MATAVVPTGVTEATSPKTGPRHSRVDTEAQGKDAWVLFLCFSRALQKGQVRGPGFETVIL